VQSTTYDQAFGASPRVYRPAVALALGSISRAAAFEQLHFWMPHATKSYLGCKWVFKSYKEWGLELGMTDRQARRTFKSLQDLGVVISMQNPHNTKDQILWWTVNKAAMSAFLGSVQEASHDIEEAIPAQKTPLDEDGEPLNDYFSDPAEIGEGGLEHDPSTTQTPPKPAGTPPKPAPHTRDYPETTFSTSLTGNSYEFSEVDPFSPKNTKKTEDPAETGGGGSSYEDPEAARRLREFRESQEPRMEQHQSTAWSDLCRRANAAATRGFER
jgi:hypothetical protein